MMPIYIDVFSKMEVREFRKDTVDISDHIAFLIIEISETKWVGAEKDLGAPFVVIKHLHLFRLINIFVIKIFEHVICLPFLL